MLVTCPVEVGLVWLTFIFICSPIKPHNMLVAQSRCLLLMQYEFLFYVCHRVVRCQYVVLLVFTLSLLSHIMTNAHLADL